MMNQRLRQRLDGIRLLLNGVRRAGASMPSASIGFERAKFVELFLARAMPGICRFGTGAITDAWGRLSGELDVVIELPTLPNVPSLGDGLPRLYLAEGVAAAIEVKTDLSRQWPQVLSNADKLSKLRRDITYRLGPGPDLEVIPHFAVGYAGPSVATLEKKVGRSCLAGALLLEDGVFVVKREYMPPNAKQSTVWEGSDALWAFICSLHWISVHVHGLGTGPAAYLDAPLQR